jgi:LytS/YehU family sensor histidine kinase
MIPTMMLQPLLENALIHGIMPSTIKGVLQMEIQEIENNLCITIIDNGIGMERSRNFQQQKNHKSRGTELIQKRIAALGHFVKEPITIKMSPAFISDHNPGNKTALCIPSALYKAWMAAQKE